MNSLEEKIKANKGVLAGKFINKKTKPLLNSKVIKVGFTDGWNNGWSNHGGPALTDIKLKSDK